MKSASKRLSVETYVHGDKKRKNNPPVGLVSTATESLDTKKTAYEHDPHVEPILSWAGKKEGMNFEISNVSLHVHERIDPKRVVKAFVKKNGASKQPSLFEDPYSELPLLKAIHFYQHEQNWTNRLIAGDSLLVMNSLLQKEGMAGKVQTIYIDPPYGIRYNSNFQPFVNDRNVSENDKDDDLPPEPEMIRAFRDTWELGIHSYLSFLYDRLLLAKELLHESGSCFLQINDENLDYARVIMDEVFGKDSFIITFPIKKKGSQKSGLIDPVNDYLIWYGRSPRATNKIKFRKLFLKRTDEDVQGFKNVLLPNGQEVPLKELKNPKGESFDYSSNIETLYKDYPGAELYRADPITIGGIRKNQSVPFTYKGQTFNPGAGNGWKTTAQTEDGRPSGMDVLASKNRLVAKGKSLYYRRFLSDFEHKELSNWWDNLGGASDPIYVVQTNTEIVKRCILMTTDPGDIVLDPTCGSGTTAYVAEQWGRRWITCDTSRVAIALSKQRLMTSKFDYYQLAHSEEGVASGFMYKKVPHITLGSIANNDPTQEEILYDSPIIDKEKIRVTGPFTVEAVPSLRTKPFDEQMPKIQNLGNQVGKFGDTANLHQWIDELKTTGIRATNNQTLHFSSLVPSAGTASIDALGEIMQSNGENVGTAVVFGQDYGPLEQRQVEQTIDEARKLQIKPKNIVFAAFHFDPEAAKDIDQMNNSNSDFKLLKAQMSVDLLTKDLRKKKSTNQSYWLIGQPDINIVHNKDGKYIVEVYGFDYYNPVSGEVDSGSIKRIAMWMLDTDYDEQSIYPDQIFFPVADSKRDWTKLAKALNGEVDEELLEVFTGVKSVPFEAGKNNKIAVKIIDDRGIESLVVKSL